jgi:phosphohistidine phosphatase SixA
MEQPN